MTTVVNTEQAAAWNGYEGNHWADNWTRYDAVNSGFNDALLDAAGIGARDRVLDIGCGNGQVTRLAAERAPRGEAVGVDLSAPMLARARAAAVETGVPNVTFEQGDAQAHPFPDAAFDVALSRFGIMFFADPVAAFGNIARALRPAGRLAFLCLDRMAGTDLGRVLAALTDQLPAGHPAAGAAARAAAPAAAAGSGGAGRDAPGPLSLADPARTREVLTAAGFTEIDITAVSAPQVWGRDAGDAGRFLGTWGPVRHLLSQVDAEVAERARRALTEALRAYEQPDAVRLRGTAWLVRAVRAGE
ncbi:methyltransferase domain-containing protein [Micromonospora sp. NPDC049559]|uniref:class I SAM-dependent methyltransferase n=1 Tax=Micromonospora sp. NPDC049559 TaxID=3155923 RepID=UPI00343FD0DB